MPENKTFDVTVVRLGHVDIQATSIEEAMAKANELPVDKIQWFDGHDATDARDKSETSLRRRDRANFRPVPNPTQKEVDTKCRL